MKKFLSLVMTGILSLSVFTLIGCSTASVTPEKQPIAQAPTIAMAFGETVTYSENGVNYIEKTLTATVEPAEALQKVDYSVKWADGATLSAEPVTDYITVTQESDGNKTAYVRCHKDFGDDTILITVRTRDGGLTATCYVTFEGLLRDFNISVPSDIQLKNTEKRGEYYELNCGGTYTLDLASKDMFGNDCVSNYTVNLTAEGGLLFYVIPKGAGAPSPYSSSVQLSGVVNSLISANVTSDGKLEIQVSENHLLSGNTISIDSTRDIQFLKSIDTTTSFVKPNDLVLSPEEFLEYQQDLVDKAFFRVDVTDTVANVTKTFKFWVESTVSNVSLDNSTLVF